MTACQLYLILSAAAVVLSNNFLPIFRQSYSWWLVPVMFIGIFLALIIIQFLIFAGMIFFTNIKKAPKGERFFRFLVRHSLPIMIFLVGARIKTEGTEKLPNTKNMLFVCNHQHDFDPVIIFSAFPKATISFIGKKDIMEEMKFVTKAMHRLSCLFIDRDNDREAAKTIISAIKILNKGERSIGLFPEGYCSKTGELQPIRNGSLKIATKAKVPVVVCVVDNTRQVVKNMFRRKTVINFRLVDVIQPEAFENMTTTELGDLIHSKMETALKEIRK